MKRHRNPWDNRQPDPDLVSLCCMAGVLALAYIATMAAMLTK